MDRFAQNLLHANQPLVPEATPVPGFERLICAPHISRNQKIHTMRQLGLKSLYLCPEST